ncbi:hypothetical protein POBR111598_10035 [Polynucleobacter brandtiae]
MPVVFWVNASAAPDPSAITPVLKVVALAPVIVKVAAVMDVGPVTFPVKVMPPESALLIVLLARTLMTRAELKTVLPVIDKVPPFRLMALAVLPKLPVTETAKVPELIVVLPA